MAYHATLATARSRAVVAESRHLLLTVAPGALWIIVFLVL
ncbi:MAG TPA: ABC transporter permease, partial [Cobetia sp.]|nr:ABC transporter permease [Cobetia sp.]